MSDIRPEIFQDIVQQRLDMLRDTVLSLSESHARFVQILLDHVHQGSEVSHEDLKRLQDDISMLHGKIVSLKKEDE